MKDKIYESYSGRDKTAFLPALCRELLNDQKSQWPLLQNSYGSLDHSVYRFLKRDGFSFQIQFNPGRIFSAAAKVDRKSIAKRKCFLCIKNLPPFQKGIFYREKYMILCNPLPIFSEHFTIAHIEHLPQALNNSFPAFLRLARDLSPDYTIFYNGPDCGASAPDHLHFQAVPAVSLPIEKDVLIRNNCHKINDMRGVSLLKTMDTGRSAIIMEGSKLRDMQEAFSRFLSAMKNVLATDTEPMINVVGLYRSGLWRVIIFPRRKFRPSVYFLEEEKRLLVSPGAVEMTGFIVTPRKKDFNRLDMKSIEGIYGEISLGSELLKIIIQDMKGNEGLWQQ
ncbi:MAG: DUF4922 domain-containing protein [Deltaproteobacteria bacterium]|nr:DUF4922 domain-containing protein [Deltaproteobacteria bacterium]